MNLLRQLLLLLKLPRVQMVLLFKRLLLRRKTGNSKRQLGLDGGV